MALHADLHLPLRAKPGRVDDGLSYRRGSGAGRRRELRVLAGRSVASLAIDTFRQRARIHGLGERCLIRRRNLRICVVAEQALVTQRPAEAGMGRTVIAGIHRPIAALFGVPGERQFDQLIAGGSMNIGAVVITRAENVVDLLFEYVDLFALEVDLITALIIFAIALQAGGIAGGCLLVISAFGRIGGGWAIKRPRHARLPV